MTGVDSIRQPAKTIYRNAALVWLELPKEPVCSAENSTSNRNPDKARTFQLLLVFNSTLCRTKFLCLSPKATNIIAQRESLGYGKKKHSVAEGDEHKMPQSLFKVLVHIVFSTKNRADLIIPEIQTALFGYIHGIVENNGSKLIVAGGTANHIHLLVSLGKKIDIPELISDIKRDSSSWIKTQDANFGNFYWQKGYGAFSIGQSQVETVVKYIERQKEHHKKQDFKAEFCALLKKYEIEYNERYVWD